MIIGRILAIAFVANVFAVNTIAQAPRNPWAEQTVSGAGYKPDDQAALLHALYDADPGVGAAAAAVHEDGR